MLKLLFLGFLDLENIKLLVYLQLQKPFLYKKITGSMDSCTKIIIITPKNLIIPIYFLDDIMDTKLQQ